MSLQYRDITSYLRARISYVRIVIVIFYIVGVIGILLPVTQPLYLKLFPLALILSLLLMFIYHESSFKLSSAGVLVLIGALGFFIEVAGVKTHMIFGHYEYGTALGFKILETPLLIGVNWIMLSYAASSLAGRMRLSFLPEIIMASLLMVIYDLVLEQVAPVLEMWNWEGGMVPFRNYLAWFVVSLVFQIIIRLTGLNTRNRIVPVLMGSQLLFLVILMLAYNPVK